MMDGCDIPITERDKLRNAIAFILSILPLEGLTHMLCA